jgi:hypothetical protein
VEEVLAGSYLDELPARLIGDKAYDSDPRDQKLVDEYGIEMIAPNRRRRSETQDRRKLRLQEALENRTALRLDAQFPPSCYQMGIPRRKLSRLCPPRLPPLASQAFIRLLLASLLDRKTVKVGQMGLWNDPAGWAARCSGATCPICVRRERLWT